MNAANESPTPVIVNVSRRAFMLGFAAGTLVLALGLPRFGRGEEEEQKVYAGDAMPHGLRDDPILFVAIAEDGTVTIICHRSEMGQGVRTSLPMVIADELEADWNRVRVVQAPGDEPRFGNQNTDGSRSMRHHFQAMRRIGAAARLMLEEAAAAHWEVPLEEVRAVNHEVVHEASGRRMGYGELANSASKIFFADREDVKNPEERPFLDKPTEWLEHGENLKLKDHADFRYIGRGNIGLVDNFDITTGRALYGIDARVEGMLHAVIARPPVYRGTVASYDDTEARAVPGVVKVMAIDPAPMPPDYQPLGGVAVIATNTWAAIRGRSLLKIEWNDGPNAGYSSDTYRERMEAAARAPGKVVREHGDVDAALNSAAKRFEAEYYIPHQAQAPMEPPVALAHVTGDSCTVWAPSQDPYGARERLAKSLDMPIEKITVNVTLLGGGFGRKSKSDFVTEAALLSRAMDGKPVQVTWTREDDLANGFPNTVSVQRIEAGLDATGKPVAWLQRSVAPTITSIFSKDAEHEAAFELGMGLVDLPFEIPNIRLENPGIPAHTRIGWFRSVFNVPHAFAIQCFVAELAEAAGRDPKDYLLELIGTPRQLDPPSLGDSWNYGEDPAVYKVDTARLRRVVETAAEAAQWGRTLPKGHGLGIAAHRSFVSYTAVVVEAAVSEEGELTIPRVDIAFDCGPVINPERVRAQLEGAVIQGVSLATVTGLTYREGRAEQTNFDGYRVTRINEAPREIHVHLIPVTDYSLPLGGAGEPGLPPVAPALVNAVHAATGKRIRSLPIGDQLWT